MSKILVIGDWVLDEWIFGHATRLSPEAACLVFHPSEVPQTNPGMAGNVAANLRSLDPFAEVHTIFSSSTNRKTRYVDKHYNQHLLRVDSEQQVSPLTFTAFSTSLQSHNYDACVISDYAKGFLDTVIIRQISDYFEARNTPVFLDTKAILGAWSRSVTYVKINSLEYKVQLSANSSPWKNCVNLIVTQGKDGIVIYDKYGKIFHTTPTNNVIVSDVSGAGDTTLAALVIHYLKTSDIKSSMDWANKAASIAVSKRGVVAVRLEDMT